MRYDWREGIDEWLPGEKQLPDHLDNNFTASLAFKGIPWLLPGKDLGLFYDVKRLVESFGLELRFQKTKWACLSNEWRQNFIEIYACALSTHGSGKNQYKLFDALMKCVACESLEAHVETYLSDSKIKSPTIRVDDKFVFQESQFDIERDNARALVYVRVPLKFFK